MSVRPCTILTLSSALLACAAPALAAGQPAPRISATLATCHPAAELSGRYATFAAQMRAVGGTDLMSIRLQLEERTPPLRDFHPVSGVPGFGAWRTSVPRVEVFGYSQEVSSLSAPAEFRVLVDFRWTGAHHRVIRRARRATPSCILPATTSSLLVGSLSSGPQ